MNKLLDRILDYRNQKTGKYNFEMRCLFREQLTYEMYCRDNKEFAYVPMQSGRTGLFEVTTERYNYTFEDTGQRNWKFTFVKFIKGDK